MTRLQVAPPGSPLTPRELEVIDAYRVAFRSFVRRNLVPKAGWGLADDAAMKTRGVQLGWIRSIEEWTVPSYDRLLGVVYVIWSRSEHDRALYVGRSRNQAMDRIAWHMQTTTWAADAGDVTFYVLEPGAPIDLIEALIIDALRPLANNMVPTFVDGEFGGWGHAA